MRNLKVMLAYNGTAYHGWQSQKNAVAIQDIIENRIAVLLHGKHIINGCSRTDTGVHAREYCFSLETESRIPTDGFVRGMNTILPPDIAILSCEDAPLDFHARFSSKGKEYVYLVNNGSQRDVFTQNLALFYPYRLDEAELTRVAQSLVGEHDFGAFCRAEAKEYLATTVRTVTDIRVERSGDFVSFYVSGTGFLHNMVRIIIGTLIYYSEGKRTENDILRALETGDRALAGKTLPPCGLYLNKVFY